MLYVFLLGMSINLCTLVRLGGMQRSIRDLERIVKPYARDRAIEQYARLCRETFDNLKSAIDYRADGSIGALRDFTPEFAAKQIAHRLYERGLLDPERERVFWMDFSATPVVIPAS